jgi:hypothetical protein
MLFSSKNLVLSLALALPLSSGTAQAFGSKPPADSSSGSGSSSGGSSSNAIIDLGLNLAITYAKMDPRYSTILTALGINSAADLRAFLSGNRNGANARDIIARLGFMQAQKSSSGRDALARLGITDERSLSDFLANAGNGSSTDMLLNLALQQALSNPKYATWAQRLGIEDAQDLKNLLKGSGSGGNLQNLVFTIGLSYVQSNPKYEKYVPFVLAAMSVLGISTGGSVDSGDPTDSGDDIIDLGPFAGMTVGEVKAVQAIR